METMRQQRWTWDDTWMSMAVDISQRSPDPNTQVGCILVNKDNRLISCGYNGVARGICPSSTPWNRKGESGRTKYDWVIHAERNAIDNATASTENGKCYITLFCCHECAKSIIQAKIKEVIYLNDKYYTEWSSKLAKEMLNRVDIHFRQHMWSEYYLI